MADGCSEICCCGCGGSCCCTTGIGYALYRYFKKGGFGRLKNAAKSYFSKEDEEEDKEVQPSKLEEKASSTEK